MPVLVSVPHYGTEALPHVMREDYSEPWFETFAYGFADTFVADLYGDLVEVEVPEIGVLRNPVVREH